MGNFVSRPVSPTVGKSDDLPAVYFSPMLPPNLVSDNAFFQENIADLTDLIMAVLEIQVNPIIDPFQDENSLYAFCMGFLVARQHAPSREMVETILIVKPFIQQLLDGLDAENAR